MKNQMDTNAPYATLCYSQDIGRQERAGQPPALLMATQDFPEVSLFTRVIVIVWWVAPMLTAKQTPLESPPRTGLPGSQGLHFYEYALSGPLAPRCPESGKISSEWAVMNEAAGAADASRVPIRLVPHSCEE